MIKDLEILQENLVQICTHLNLEQKKQRYTELESEMSEPYFWQTEGAADKAKKAGALKAQVDFWEGLQNDATGLREIAEQEGDQKQNDFLESEYTRIQNLYLQKRFESLLSGSHDSENAIFALHAGAGGTDAQDWTEMLLRMFSRYCSMHNLKTEIIELSRGSEAGIKSVLVEATGENAYGLLRSEAGVHRLVRLSPFNPAKTRETSFALLEVLPVTEGISADFQINPQDIEVEVTTSSGHGGQSVNTTYSAVRMTHKPSGIKVSIQNERSQKQNREIALRVLTAKVRALEETKLEEERKLLRGELKSAEWGNQIRSYVLHPYKLVKDHRTSVETSDVTSVLDGYIDMFVEKFLEMNIENTV